MSHPLGALHTHAPSLSTYRLGQDAMHRAFRLVNRGAFDDAADQFRDAARAAKTLAAHTASIEPERAHHWQLVAMVRTTFAREARAAAADERALVPEVAPQLNGTWNGGDQR